MIALEVQVNGALVDPAIVVADVTVRSGRERADDGLSAASATVDLLSPNPLGNDPAGVGDDLAIVANGSPRFAGRISEVTRSTSSSDPFKSTYTLVAVGPIARLPRLLVAVPLAAASAAARATAVFAAAGVPAVIDGGTTYQLAAYGLAGDPPAAADAIVSALMNDTGAVVADVGDGSVLVQFPEARIGGDVWAPDPELTHIDLAWEQTDDLVNDATVRYGVDPNSGSVRATNEPSIDRFDPHAVELTTGLGDAGSATRRANSLVARLSTPAWAIGSVQTWDPDFFEHAVGAVVTLAPLPASSPMAGSWAGVLEGWTETYEPATDGTLSGLFDLAISDRQHSAETLVWSAVNPAELWQTVNPETSWQEAISNADL